MEACGWSDVWPYRSDTDKLWCKAVDQVKAQNRNTGVKPAFVIWLENNYMFIVFNIM